MDNATKDLIADMIESGQGAITGRARTWLNSQVAHALATALAEREAERAEIARLRAGLEQIVSYHGEYEGPSHFAAEYYASIARATLSDSTQ